MRIEIFDVEHGSCALVTADTGSRMLIDCGSNSTTGWRPSTHLPNSRIRSIDMFAVTNYDEDHFSDLPNLRELHWDYQPTVQLKSLLCNRTISKQALQQMKKNGGIGSGIQALMSMINDYTGDPLVVNWGSLSYSVFCNSYPNDFTDTNNLSLVLILHCFGLHIIFPGDLETAGWEKLLKNDAFVEELKSVNVFVASHHGRESGCCDAIFQIERVMPEIVVFSDAGIQFDTQKTANWYRMRSHGINYRGGRRHVFTTRRDGKITLEANSQATIINTAV